MANHLHHNRIVGTTALVNNLRATGQHSRADTVEELMTECLRLRQGLWDVAQVCGEDLDGNETPAPFDGDIVEFALNRAKMLWEEAQVATPIFERIRGCATDMWTCVMAEKAAAGASLEECLAFAAKYKDEDVRSIYAVQLEAEAAQLKGAIKDSRRAGCSHCTCACEGCGYCG